MRGHKLAEKRQIPASLKNIKEWQISRRNFVKGMLIVGAATQIPFLSACVNNSSNEEELPFGQLNKKQKSILKEIQIILFPNDGNGPSSTDINATDYLQWVISDPRMDPSEVKYIINGIKWVDETSDENFSDDFLELSDKEKESIVKMISKESWGENWLSVILTLIFEALLSDPQYGGNKDSIGWKWLNHYPGYPRPTEDLIYDNIFNNIV